MKFAVWSSEALSGRQPAQPGAEWPRGGHTDVSHGVVNFLKCLFNHLSTQMHNKQITLVTLYATNKNNSCLIPSFYTPKTEAPTWGVSAGAKVFYFPFLALLYLKILTFVKFFIYVFALIFFLI